MIFLIGISVIFVIFIGGRLYIKGEIDSIGVITEFTIYVMMLTWPVATVGWVSNIVQQAEASQGRINEFLNEKSDIETFENEEEYNIAKKEYEYSVIKQNLQIEDLGRYGIKIYLIDSYEEITEILRVILNKYKRKTIFISGSAEEYEKLGKEKAIEFIRKLSFKLAKNGYKVVNGYGLGIGTYIINGVTEYCYENCQIKVEDSLKLMPFPLSAKNNDKLRDTWEKYREEMISQCGIAIYMFGNKKKDGKIIKADGVRKEYNIAKSNQLINIPLAFTGYITEDLYNENSNEIKNILEDKEINYITEFYDIDTNVDGIIKIVNRLNNKE